MNRLNIVMFVAGIFLSSLPLSAEDIEPGTTPNSGFTDDPAEIAKIEQYVAWQNQSMKQITVRELNVIHKRFVDQCIPLLPRDITIAYLGDVARDNGRLKMKILTNDVSHVLHWNVQGDFVYFTFWVSIMKTPETVTTCRVGRKTFYLNVSHVHELQGIKKKLAELNNMSVREVLAPMQKHQPRTAAE